MPNPSAATTFEEISYFVVKGSRLGREGLEKYARGLGQDGKPLPQDTIKTDAETAVINAFRDDVQLRANTTSDKLREIVADFIAKRDTVPTDATMEDIHGDNLNTAVHHVLTVARERLQGAYRSHQKTLRSLLFFKADAGLDRDVHPGHSLYLHYGVILSLIVVESFLNLWFFAQGSDQGMLGGFFEALFVSLINVGTAVVMGQIVLPHKNVKKQKPVILGVMGIYVLVVLVLNLTVAHYRDLMVGGTANAVQASLGALWQHPFDLSFHSTLLLVVGFLAAGLGLWEGYHSDDPHPGYSRVSHAQDEALSEYERVKAECRTRAADLAKGVVPSMQAEIENGRQIIKQMQELVRSGMAAHETFMAARTRREGECNQTLKTFREANRSVRGAAPAPLYFDTYEDFGAIVATASNWSDLPGWLAEAERHLAGAKSKATELTNRDEERHKNVRNLCVECFVEIEKEVNLQDPSGTGVHATKPKIV